MYLLFCFDGNGDGNVIEDLLGEGLRPLRQHFGSFALVFSQQISEQRFRRFEVVLLVTDKGNLVLGFHRSLNIVGKPFEKGLIVD